MRSIERARLAVLLAVSAVAAGAGPAAATDPDLDAILDSAKEVQAADTAAWARYRFRRQAVREVLDGEDEVEERQDLEFIVTPRAGGFDELLVRADGLEPEPEEVKRQRRLGRFARHYATLATGTSGHDIESAYSLSLLLDLSAYRYAGLETIDGVPCHRIDFFPDEGAEKSGLAGKIARATAGTLWLTAQGYHLARAVAATVRPVSIAFALAQVNGLKVSLESRPVGDDVWLPRRIEMVTHARVLVKGIHRRNVYLYSEFERLDPSAAP